LLAQVIYCNKFKPQKIFKAPIIIYKRIIMRAADVNIIRTFIDPYLNMTIQKRIRNPQSGVMANALFPVIVDDGMLVGNHPMMTGSQIAVAQLLKAGAVGGNRSSIAYWREYGRLVFEKFRDGEPLGLRCDSCAALAYFILTERNCSASISVVEQSQGNANGHWFLLLGAAENAGIAYPSDFPYGSLVVDLWGVGVLRQRHLTNQITSVVKPATCIYSTGNNVLKIRATRLGHTVSIPTRIDFVNATTVRGWISLKERSVQLRNLDDVLDKFHIGEATLLELANAFKGWVNDKAKRQGPNIDSIRNATGKITELRDQLRWLGQDV
jgi:hypothetical protein